MNLNNFLQLGGWLIIIVIGLLIFREIMTWYWKINKIVRLLERIERNTRKEGLRYPDDEYDEEYFERNKIHIPGQNPTDIP